MKEKGSTVMNLFLLPFRLVQKVFGFGNEQVNFIKTQNRLDNEYKSKRRAFIRMKKKTYRSNDELV